ncbi:MAG: ABC transporter permease [Rhodospirillaceae bacterium]|nr:ABC transporter permease [Rhodospirillaceae bacterium]
MADRRTAPSGARRRSMQSSRLRGIVTSLASPIVLFVLWEIGARTGFLDARVLPPPTAVAVTIWDMILNDQLLQHTGITTLRFLVGMIVGSVPGILLGMTMGLFRPVRVVLNPLVAILYPIPRIALFPLVLILVGLNETSNIIMIAIGPFFTMLITAMSAVINVEPIYRDVAKNFGVKPRHLYFTVTLPAVLPSLMAGLLVSLGLALLGTVAVEFLVSTLGLGYVIWNAWSVLSLTRSMAGLVVAAILGAACYLLMDWMERVVTPWQRPAKR